LFVVIVSKLDEYFLSEGEGYINRHGLTKFLACGRELERIVD